MTIFDNVSSIIINNKEVQSIVITDNNAVLYEKKEEHNYELSFSQNTYIANNGTCTIVVSLTDNELPVSNEEILVRGSDYTIYRVTTNNQGIGSINLNKSEGTDLTFEAEFDNLSANCIVSGTLQSDLFFVYDTTESKTFKSGNPASFNNALQIYTGDVYIDWGDGVTTQYSSGPLTHTYENDGIYTIKIIGDVTVINSYVFGISTIGAGIVSDNTVNGICEVVIPSYITSLGGGLFLNNVGLQSVTIHSNALPLYGFSGCSNLVDVRIPPIDELSQQIFQNTGNIQNVNINNISFISLGESCFKGCSWLQSINISNATIIGSACFKNCTGLTSIDYPNIELYSECFKGCNNIEDYQLHWLVPPTYSSNNMPINQNTYLTIPYGTTDIYVDMDYPIEKLIERQSDGHNKIQFTQMFYNSSDGNQTIELYYLDGIGTSQTITLNGNDGSEYTVYTDSNTGYASVELIGYGDIYYIATCGDDYGICKVNGMDNQLEIQMPTCAKTSSGSGSSKKTILTWTVKDNNGDIVPDVSAKVCYYSKASSSASNVYSTFTVSTNSSGQITRSWTVGTKTYPAYYCTTSGTTGKRPAVTGNWKYKSYTYPAS